MSTGASPGAGAAAASSAWHEIGDRVFVRRYEFLDQTIPVVLGDGVALVVDTRSTLVQGRELLAELRALAPDLRPIENGGLIVVNTHHHWDHTFGNAAFRPAPIWGHVRCVARMRECSEAARKRVVAAFPEIAADFQAVEVDPPDHVFAERERLLVGDRPVELRYLGRGHTDDDIVLVVPDAPAVFAGDLVEQGAPPSFGDAFPLDWAATLGAVLDLADAAGGRDGGLVVPIVPGHGDVVDRGFVEAQLADIAALAEFARRVHTDGGGIDEAMEVAPFSPPVRRQALERAFGQLRGEL